MDSFGQGRNTLSGGGVLFRDVIGVGAGQGGIHPRGDYGGAEFICGHGVGLGAEGFEVGDHSSSLALMALMTATSGGSVWPAMADSTCCFVPVGNPAIPACVARFASVWRCA